MRRTDSAPEAAQEPSRWGNLAGLAFVVTWSSGFIGAELAARAGSDPIDLLAWRFGIFAVLLSAVWLALRRPWPSILVWRRQALLSLLCQVIYLFCIFEAVRHGVHGGTAALIAALQPLLVATVAGRFLGERTTRVMWLGMLIGFAGVAIVVAGDLSADTPGWAYALPVGGMISLTLGTILTRRTHAADDIFTTILTQSVVSALGFVALDLLTGAVTLPTEPDFWLAVVWLIALPSLGGYVMYIVVTKTQGATVISTLLYLTPPTTMIWALLMFGTPVTPLGILGLIVSALGVGLVLRGRRSTQAVPLSG